MNYKWFGNITEYTCMPTTELVPLSSVKKVGPYTIYTYEIRKESEKQND